MGVTSRRRNARVVGVPYAAYSREMPHIWNKRAIQSCLSLETKSSDVSREDIADSTGKWRIFEKKSNLVSVVEIGVYEKLPRSNKARVVRSYTEKQ